MTNFMVTGHIVKDATTRTVPVSGIPTLVTDFTIGVNDSYDSNTGKYRYSQFWKVTVWREHGAKMAPHLVKGRQVAVTGIPTSTAWIDSEGKARSTMEIREAKVAFEGKKPDDPDELPFDPTEE